MMKKRVLAILLVLIMVVGLFPGAVRAEEPKADLTEEGLTVEGSNGFGALLSQDITQKQEALQEASGYTLTALEITGNVATVTYNSMEKATLVVAIYSEEGQQLLTSGKTQAEPTKTQAEVTITGTLPAYFRATAYLLDSYDLSPLCPAYETPMYTRQMQELLHSTVADYDPELVLNLDGDTQTNFAVYAETTKQITPCTGTNLVLSADDESRTYVIGNVDDQITSLQPGDVISYAYGEGKLLLVKVGTINLEGDTAQIIGQELDLQEVFSYMKIEGKSTTEDMTVDDSKAYPGITYQGLVDEPAEARSLSGGVEGNASHQFGCDLDIKEETDYLSADITMVGTLKFEIGVGIYYYISTDICYVEFKITPTVTLEASLGGRICGYIPLGEITVSPIPGVYVGFEPRLELTFAGKISVTVKLEEAVIGMRYDNKEGLKNISSKPKITPALDVEMTMFFGVDFQPKVTLLGDGTVKLSMRTLVGVELKVKGKGTDYEIYTGRESQQHTCRECLDISLTFKAELTGKLQFFNCDWAEVKIDIGKWSLPLGKAYYSVDRQELGTDACPHITYRLVITVKDAEEKAISGALVTNRRGEALGTTNRNGVLVVYLPGGVDQLTASTESLQSTQVIHITEGTKANFTLGTPEESKKETVFDTFTPQDSHQMGIVNEGTVTASGRCGENLTWELYSSGTLKISGTGGMDSYDGSASRAPWYTKRDKIRKVVIGDGVESIGQRAFYSCYTMTDVLIPESVTAIGDYAFAFSGLTKVTVPNSVVTMGVSVFEWCESLSGVVLPEGLTAIPSFTFFRCRALKNVAIPLDVTRIGYGAFSKCVGLTNIAIPERVTHIEPSAFGGCTGLTSIRIPDRVIEIGDGAFGSCTKLKTIDLPQGVTSIAPSLFEGCTGLTTVRMSECTTSIGDNAFKKCTALKELRLPDSITTIGEYAFSNCESLTQISVPKNVTAISNRVFYCCAGLTSVVLPDGLVSIGSDVFWYCTSLTDITIPDSVTNIEDGAFIGCSSLEMIRIPGRVQVIKANTFALCSSLKEIVIPAGAVEIEGYAFSYCTGLEKISIPTSVTAIGELTFQNCPSLTEIYYAGTQEQWNGMSVGQGNAALTDAVVHFNSPTVLSGMLTNQLPQFKAVFGGEYGVQEGLKTAAFENLAPGKEYVLLVLASLEGEVLLSGDNLLYIGQTTAAEDGTAIFRYLPRVNTEPCYVMACGASTKDLQDAVITFPTMTANGEAQAVEPTVVYEGKTLVQGRDYVLAGNLDYSEAGRYTCHIRGIHGYTGLVTCNFEVKPKALPGDVNGDGKVNVADVSRLYGYIRGLGSPIPQGDINGDGKINVADVSKLYGSIRGIGKI